MFDAVLVPTDGSDLARAAERCAADVASHYDATLHVLSVVDERHLDNAPHLEERRETVTERTADEAAALSPDGPPVEQAVRTGLPHEEILDYAEEADVDLVVMGTHGRTGLERQLLGSVTERVLRTATVPVLTVRQGIDDEPTTPFERVLVTTDGSDGAAVAVDPAIDVADRYGATLHALSVLDPTAMGYDVRSEVFSDADRERAEAAVEEVGDRAAAAGLPVETAVVEGTPHRAIADYVGEAGVDLVVMGTHGRSGLERYLIGSVTEKVVRTAPVPVLTVPIPEA